MWYSFPSVIILPFVVVNIFIITIMIIIVIIIIIIIITSFNVVIIAIIWPQHQPWAHLSRCFTAISDCKGTVIILFSCYDIWFNVNNPCVFLWNDLIDGAALEHNIWFQDLNWIPVSPMSLTQRQVIHQQILPCRGLLCRCEIHSHLNAIKQGKNLYFISFDNAWKWCDMYIICQWWATYINSPLSIWICLSINTITKFSVTRSHIQRIYRQMSNNIRRIKSKNINGFSSRPVVVFAQSTKDRCQVGNEDVVGAAPTGDASTTSEWSTISRPTKVILILKTGRYL